MELMPTAFVPHGGGPWPIIKLSALNREDERLALYHYMTGISKILPEAAKALVVISAHWEEQVVTINSKANPALLFDYYGFPKEAYEYQWPAPGNPDLAKEIFQLLTAKNIPCALDDQRDLDHGIFIPLMLAYPKADVPIIQISLVNSLDPAAHFELGQALESLRKRGIFIIGSGNSYHNLRKFFTPDDQAVSDAKAFDTWLSESMLLPQDKRKNRLLRWADAPSAWACHPRAEHLLPLLVCAGAAGKDPGHITWKGTTNGLLNSAFHFS